MKCGDCAAHMTKGCHLYEYSDQEMNWANCAPTDPADPKCFKSKTKSREDLLWVLSSSWKWYCDRNDPNLTLYIWMDGSWKAHSEAIFLKELAAFYGSEKPKVNKEELRDYFKGESQDTPVAEKPPELIPFKNGLYNLKTKQLEPLTWTYFITNTLPFNYNPESGCPNWIDFITEVHSLEDLHFIQEWWGYQLYTAYPRKMLVVLIGNTNNGKTIELDIMKHVLGPDNYTPITLQELTYQEYYGAELHHKLANICDELPSNKIKNVEKLDNAASGGMVSARRIYGQPFKFMNVAKFTYATNEPPEIVQDLDAFWGRLHVVECPYRFEKEPKVGEKQAIDREVLEESLKKEVEGIFNWMLQGLIRIYENGWKFSYSRSVEQNRKYYRIKANPVVSWIEEKLEYTGDDSNIIRPQDAYDDFRKWCEANRIKKIPTRSSFFRRMHEEGIVPKQSRAHDMDRVYFGYTWKTSEDVTP